MSKQPEPLSTPPEIERLIITKQTLSVELKRPFTKQFLQERLIPFLEYLAEDTCPPIKPIGVRLHSHNLHPVGEFTARILECSVDLLGPKTGPFIRAKLQTVYGQVFLYLHPAGFHNWGTKLSHQAEEQKIKLIPQLDLEGICEELLKFPVLKIRVEHKKGFKTVADSSREIPVLVCTTLV